MFDLGESAVKWRGAATVSVVVESDMGCTSEVGVLRAAIVHRPGAEYQRRDDVRTGGADGGGSAGLEQARDEHDAFCELLHQHDVEVLEVADLLTEALSHSGAARMQGLAAAVDSRRIGTALANHVSAHLRGLSPERLARVLIGGLTFDELPADTATEASLVLRMHRGTDYVIDPLPSLVFTRDSSIWIGPRVVIPSLAWPTRAREASLTDLIYAHHPRFTGVRKANESRVAPVDGGDVLLLASGVVALGVGRRATPAGVEALARSLFDDGLAQTVLAVPIDLAGVQPHLDETCVMVDVDTVAIRAEAVATLTAFAVRNTPAGIVIDAEEPFAAAAARVMGAGALGVVSGCASGALALAPGVVVAYQHAIPDIDHLSRAGIEVLTIPGVALGASRGGPRSLVCPVTRDPLS